MMKNQKSILQPIFDLVDEVDPELINLRMSAALNNDNFDEEFAHHDFLGFNYNSEETLVRLWAPTALAVDIFLYEDMYSDEPSDIFSMDESRQGNFIIELLGDYDEVAYMFKLYFPNGKITFTADPYAKAVTANGRRSVIVDLESTKPKNWQNDEAPTLTDVTSIVIYEANIRDFTAGESSGIKDKRHFLGLTETATTSPAGNSTGIDYLAELGVTHIQFMPLADFATVDELNEDKDNYNWGYDPLHFNVPDGSFATDAASPKVRLIEMRKMIQAIHNKGLNVIMDVVYNHVYQPELHPLGKTVPGYYFRANSEGELYNGTGVGNDTASEHQMMRRYIVDSVLYWAKEFHIDGFRFDLMGIHDIETMNLIRKELNKLDGTIIVLGEGWNLDTRLEKIDKATLVNAHNTPGIAYFNDQIRDAVKGSDFDYGKDTGYITGKFMIEQNVLASFMGGANLSRRDALVNSPQQLIQYIASHDNYTLADKIYITHSFETQWKRQKRQLLGNSIIALSQGIPFFHSGQEFFRTKKGIRNTYDSSEDINKIDWSLRDEYEDSVQYLSDLLALRHRSELFHLHSFDAIQTHTKIIKADFQIIGIRYTNNQDDFIVIFNAQDDDVGCWIPDGEWQVLARDNRFLHHTLEIHEGQQNVSISAISTLILEKIKREA